jgi:hypothetical protein
MIDIARPEHVEVHISADAKTLWVNVDGTCRLRAGRIESLTLINDADPSSGGLIHPYRDPQPEGAA